MRQTIAGLLVSSALISMAAFATDTRSYAVEERSNPQEQLRLAAALSREALTKQDSEERREAVSRAALHYEVVLVKWPDDRVAKVGALLGQADLFLNARRAPDAVDALNKALPLIENTLDEPQVRAKLGQALFRLGRTSEAETAFREAEVAARRNGNPGLERLTMLTAAGFFADTGRHAEAAARFRSLARTDSFDAADRAMYAVKAAEQQSKVAKDGQFNEDVAYAKKLIAAARSANNQGQGSRLDIIERHFARIVR